MITLLSLNTAAARPLHIKGRKVWSAIGKQTRTEAVAVGKLGLAGDEQADPQWHGGVSKAVYAYPAEHYAWWEARRRGRQASLFGQQLPHGFFGENLTVHGLLEDNVCVGDMLHFPDCILRVTEPRQPCFKFVHVMGYGQAAKDMVESGFCGWYLAVQQTGTLQAGQQARLEHGPRQTCVKTLLRKRRND